MNTAKDKGRIREYRASDTQVRGMESVQRTLGSQCEGCEQEKGRVTIRGRKTTGRVSWKERDCRRLR